VETISFYKLRFRTGSAISAALVLLAACDSIPSDPIVGEPTIVGDITMVDSSGSRLRVLVEENVEVQQPTEPGGSKMWFTIWESTDVFDSRGVAVTRASGQSLLLGLRVEGLADGLILDSYPQQADAETIVIID
jgi:hypothetical protein